MSNDDSYNVDLINPIKSTVKRYKRFFEDPDNARKYAGNRKGTKQGYTVTDIMEAIQRWEDKNKDKGNFLDYLFNRLEKSDKVLISVLRKLLPDLSERSGDAPTNIIINRPDNPKTKDKK